MSKWLALIFCFFSCVAVAQIELLNPKNPAIVGDQVTHIFDGTPAVLIEKTKSEPTEPKTEQKIPVVPDVAIKTPFGHDRTAAFINQVTDAVVWVQILDSNDIRVTEQIQFLTTEDDFRLERIFQTRLTDPVGRLVNPKIEILSFEIDQRKQPYTLEKDQGGFNLKALENVKKGVHSVTLEYLIQGVILADRSLMELTIPIMGRWSWITERMTVIVLMPKSTRFYVRELLFGSNNVPVAGQARVIQDLKGSLVFQTERPLPAYAETRLHLIFEKAGMMSAPVQWPAGIVAGGIYLGVFIGYVILSILFGQLKKWKKPIVVGRRISPVLWGHLLGYTVPVSQLPSPQNGIVWPKFATLYRHPILLNLLTGLRFIAPYIAEVLILNGILLFLLTYWQVVLPMKMTVCIILCDLLGIAAIYQWGIKVELKHLRNRFKYVLLQTPQGLNLAPREIATYFVWSVYLKFHAEWRRRLIANNPTYRKLSFLMEKEK